MLLDTTPNLYTLDFATELVIDLNLQADDWRYEIVLDPYAEVYNARIDVYDEMDDFVGSF